MQQEKSPGMESRMQRKTETEKNVFILASLY